MKTRSKLVLLFLLVAVVAALWATVAWLVGGKVPTATLLEADFTASPIEYVPDEPLAQLAYRDTPHTLDWVEALRRAAGDDRVVGLVARVGGSGTGLAQIQELRDAVAHFRGAGKMAIAWADTLGEGSPATGAYYLASAFDEIYIQPSGDVGLTGLVSDTPFLRGTLDKLGIVPRLDHRYEFKNAMNMFTEKGFTEAHKEATQAVLDSFYTQIVRGIAEGRHLGQEEVRDAIDRGPYLGREAVETHLVDGLAYRDEVYTKAKEKVGGNARLLDLGVYLDRAGRPWDDGTKIALIYGVGGVARGDSGFDALNGLRMGSDSVAKAFRDAVDDPGVKAILFRVDSPGGSYVASDTIWNEVRRARQQKKPVVVSMGDVAGSGGYFVAMGADKIVAQPATITGSIGVLGGKMLTDGMWAKLGVSWGQLSEGANATMWSSHSDYTDAEWKRFQASLDRIYDDFVSKVAEGRNLPRERVEEIARGRIWSGADAKTLGLVDELGGFPTALRLVRQVAGLPEGAPLRLTVFPKKRGFLERLFAEKPESSEARAALTAALRATRPAARLAVRLGLATQPGELTLPEPTVNP